MSFNVVRFYQDFHVKIVDSGKHVTPGWVNTGCPFCGGNEHLGVHVRTGAVKCWRCGTHSQLSVIKAMLGCSWERAKEIEKEYGAGRRTRDNEQAPKTALERSKKVCEYPSGSLPLSAPAMARHRAYLEGRGYDSYRLESVWGLRGTDHLGRYKFRIIAPITVNGRVVSYQGRDYTGKSELKYKACRKEDELIDHQTVVYGLDLAKGDTCLLVEGIADVWRLGPGAVCCFGIAFTISQCNLLAERFRTVHILFDGGEEEAQKQARKMALLLAGRGVEVELLTLDQGDPGEMQQEEADALMNELLLEGYSNYKEAA